MAPLPSSVAFSFSGPNQDIHGSGACVCAIDPFNSFFCFPWIPMIPGPYITVGGIAASFLTKRIKCPFQVPWEAACIFWCRFSRLKRPRQVLKQQRPEGSPFDDPGMPSSHALAPGHLIIFEDKQAALSLVESWNLREQSARRFGSTWIVLIGFGTGFSILVDVRIHFYFCFVFVRRGRGNGKSSNFR